MTKLTPEILREAVELAEGWQWADYGDDDIQLELADGAYWFCDDDPVTPEDMPKLLIAALASQLISQVDAIKATRFISDNSYASLLVQKNAYDYDQKKVKGPNRDDNSIIACVEFLRERA